MACQTMTNSKARLQPPPSPMFFFKIFWCLRSRFLVCSTPHKHLACTGTDAEGEHVTLLWAVDVLGSYVIIFHTTCFRFLCRNANVPARLDQCMAAPQRSAVVRVVLRHVGWPCLNKGGTMRFARMKRLLQKCHEWNQVEAVHCLLQAGWSPMTYSVQHPWGLASNWHKTWELWGGEQRASAQIFFYIYGACFVKQWCGDPYLTLPHLAAPKVRAPAAFWALN